MVICHISETVQIQGKLLLLTHRKSHTGFLMEPKLVTLNVIELHNGRYFLLFHGIKYIGAN